MARIRSIKPEFPQSQSMGNVSRDARLTFIELWLIADDEGRLRGSPRMLASLLFPYDVDAGALIDGWLAELERESCLQRYEIDGHAFIQILNWLKYQRIDHPCVSKIEPIREPSRVSREPSRGSPTNSAGNGTERNGTDIHSSATPPLESFPEAWNRLRQNLPGVQEFSKSRQKKVHARINQGITLERFEQAVRACTEKPFLRGEGERGWTATFDWLIENDRNIEKAITGYNSQPNGRPKSPFGGLIFDNEVKP